MSQNGLFRHFASAKFLHEGFSPCRTWFIVQLYNGTDVLDYMCTETFIANMFYLA